MNALTIAEIMVRGATLGKPMLLRDLLETKRGRGDTDCDDFAQVTIEEFASGLDATLEGAHWAMRQWVKDPRGYHASYQRKREAFLACLERAMEARRV